MVGHAVDHALEGHRVPRACRFLMVSWLTAGRRSSANLREVEPVSQRLHGEPGIGGDDLLFPRLRVGVQDDPGDGINLDIGVVIPDGVDDALGELFVAVADEEALQRGRAHRFVAVLPEARRAPQRGDLAEVMGEGGGDDGGDEELVSAQIVLCRIEGGFQHVIRVVVQRDLLEDLQEGFVLTEFRILAVIGLARYTDHRGNFAAVIEDAEKLSEGVQRANLADQRPMGSDEGVVVLDPPLAIQRGDFSEGRWGHVVGASGLCGRKVHRVKTLSEEPSR